MAVLIIEELRQSLFDYQVKPSIGLSLAKFKDLYLDDMVIFLVNFKVANIVKRKRKREQEEAHNAKQKKAYEA